MTRLENARVLMYSHDTFGLGHLRRCRTIAHALVERFKGLHVLIISGSPIAGAFEFRARVDFVKIPSVIKLYDGEYTSMDKHIDLADTMSMRKGIIQHTAESYQPDIFIVDKEPLGLKGELEPTLAMLKARGAVLVLGLREVMDDPELLRVEWQQRDVMRKIERYYDDIWVYGPRSFWDPLAGLDASAVIRSRMTYAGYIRRGTPVVGSKPRKAPSSGKILVTAGGGGDGAELMRDVLAAYEHDPGIAAPALMVLGPFLGAEERDELHLRADALPQVTMLDFDSRLETLVKHCAAVVGMCGYNTFCEVLSYDKPALIVPRIAPRREQLIRARRAAELGLIEMLMPDQAKDPAVMAAALRKLLVRQKPSQVETPIRLDGLLRIGDRVGAYLAPVERPRLVLAAGE